MEQNDLLKLLENTLKYTGIVYNQSLYSNVSAFENEFILEYKHTSLATDSLLFFVPSVSSNDSGICKLIIKIPFKQNANDANYSYRSKEYTIVVETNNGSTRYATKNDIIAFRMCIFRFKSNNDKQIILCNSPLYDDALFSSLKVTNCEFINIPTIKNTENVNQVITLATSLQIAALENRVKALEDKFITGPDDPELVLADKPSGTIYIQYEKD